MLPGYRYNETHLWGSTERILPNKEQHTRSELLRAASECEKCFSKTLLPIYQPFSVERSSTLNMEAVGSCEKLANVHHTTCHQI